MESHNQTNLLAGPLTGPLQLLRESWDFYRAHWKVLTSIMVLPIALIYVAQALFAGNDIPLPLMLLGVLVALAGGILSVAMRPAVVDAINKLHIDGTAHIDIKHQLRYGLSFFWPLIWVSILSAITVWGGFIVLIIPGIILAGFIGLATFSLIIDGKKGVASLLDSYTLVKGRWWGVFGRLLSVAVVFIIMSFIVQGLEAVIKGVFAVSKVSATAFMIDSVLGLVLSLVISGFGFVFSYRLYEALKATRTPNVETRVFRKWIIATWVVCLIGILTLPIILFATLGKAGSAMTNYKSASTYSNVQYK